MKNKLYILIAVFSFINALPLQVGDIVNTRSSTKNLRSYISVKKTTNYKKGIKEFVQWYKSYAKK